ncbi:hypothetical protein HBI56_136580 [Parastagonospora nodorum]|uniref:Uncharacterized protein n=1 Tax=Phaeosphaeria nodorum (strain SN15 / ATCC MYA-4574 / FGSC 10173) TaxID=321614 RepID=A0A7U2I1E9_PHANO|nr:hypothetical protein HBH56_039670 [Parastagonospora nodorum]QRC99765.1 hypothetical protein JI435_067070 [Parastagonospora nodorum SN15]KAH3933442.1 hypothetical protein HBH54_059790 [Parastagonospora nodorum]KAH3941025.1 hypothetical protein HBH53_208490 [Parastagonospora nodorum]KAH3958038.1 hypothetical protein HBH51_216170 [Parastagonospora nodorum]
MIPHHRHGSAFTNNSSQRSFISSSEHVHLCDCEDQTRQPRHTVSHLASWSSCEARSFLVDPQRPRASLVISLAVIGPANSWRPGPALGRGC